MALPTSVCRQSAAGRVHDYHSLPYDPRTVLCREEQPLFIAVFCMSMVESSAGYIICRCLIGFSLVRPAPSTFHVLLCHWHLTDVVHLIH